MKKLMLAIAGSGCAMLAAGPAVAADATGFYGKLGIGVTLPVAPKMIVTAGAEHLESDLGLKTSPAFSGEIGYALNGPRVGVELRYQQSKVGTLSRIALDGEAIAPSALSPDRLASVAGRLAGNVRLVDLEARGLQNEIELRGKLPKIQQFGLMLNAYYDFDSWNGLRPYLGGGVGVMTVKYKAFDGSLSKTSFAYQALAGVAYEFSERAALTFDYRYSWAKGLTGQNKFDPTLTEDISGIRGHTFAIGFRFGI